MTKASLPFDLQLTELTNASSNVRLRFNGGAGSSDSNDWSVCVDGQVVFTGTVDSCRDWLDLYEYESQARERKLLNNRTVRGEHKSLVSKITSWLNQLLTGE